MITRLSSPVEDLNDHCEVVVVGSGYGAISTACSASAPHSTLSPHPRAPGSGQVAQKERS